MTKLRLEDFRVDGFIDRLNAFFWVYVRSNVYGAFRQKNFLKFISLVLMLLVLLVYMPAMFIAALSNLSSVIACGLDACQNDQFFTELAVGLMLAVLTFAPIIAMMYMGTYYKIGDFEVVALLSEDNDSIGIYGLTGRRAGANKRDPNRPGVFDTVDELTPALIEYADRKDKKIIIPTDSQNIRDRYMPVLNLVEEKSLFGTQLVRLPRSETATIE